MTSERMTNRYGVGAMKQAMVAVCVMVTSAVAEQSLLPAKDGTIVDGGVFGPFDGTPDSWDYYFNETSYEGAISLVNDTSATGIEHRVFWEYNLSGVTLEPPVSALLTFVMRGPPVLPFPDVEVFVYSYPADLVESPADFDTGPAVLRGSAVVGSFQPPTAFSVIVTGAVNEALVSGAGRVAFRFQIDPNTENAASQAFIDALDSDPSTKPVLKVSAGATAVPGDVDGDGDVDLTDYSFFYACVAAPNGVSCGVFDFDEDGDVDLADFGVLQILFSGTL